MFYSANLWRRFAISSRKPAPRVIPQQKVLFGQRKEYQPRINAENADFVLIFCFIGEICVYPRLKSVFLTFCWGITTAKD
jgi:hypothetical protein